MASHHSISPPPSKRRRLSLSTSSPEASNQLSSTPINTHLRIFSWNVNGIAPLLQPPLTTFFNPASSTSPANHPPKAPLRAFLARHSYPQILCLQEVKISPKDTATQRSVERAANPAARTSSSTEDAGPRYIVKFSLPRDKYNARGFGGKVYGVATVIRSDFYAEWVTSVREADWDLEGRVLMVESKGGLSVFNIYAVNGTENAYRSPETGDVIGTRHDKKREFHKLLLRECRRSEAGGSSVVLAGDMNVARDQRDGVPGLRQGKGHVRNRADFNDKFFGDGPGSLGAVDVFRQIHGDQRKFTYYPRGVRFGDSCDRVDLVVVSRRLVDREGLVEADIMNTPQERGHSDHVPLFVTLDMDTIGNRFQIGEDGRALMKGDS